MTKLVNLFLFVFLSTLIIFSCVKEESESEESIQDRILKAYIEVTYGDIPPTASGIYVVGTTPGTGASMEDVAYAYVKYSTRSREGTYSFSSYDSIAKQLGSYAIRNYYGASVWPIGHGIIASGLEEIVKTMKIDGKVKAVLPPKLLSDINYIQVYDIELDTFVVDIEKYQIDQLEKYADKYYPTLDSLKEGFYFEEIPRGSDTDSIPDEAVLNIKYIGRHLDGTVFDTNIRDSSIKYEILNGVVPNEAKMEVIYMKDFKLALEKNTGTKAAIHGFLLAITQMREYQDKCITFFDSSYGYEAKASSTIPGYSPLFFEIWIDDEPDTE